MEPGNCTPCAISQKQQRAGRAHFHSHKFLTFLPTAAASRKFLPPGRVEGEDSSSLAGGAQILVSGSRESGRSTAVLTQQGVHVASLAKLGELDCGQALLVRRVDPRAGFDQDASRADLISLLLGPVRAISMHGPIQWSGAKLRALRFDVGAMRDEELHG
jgi:hypothetical protein